MLAEEFFDFCGVPLNTTPPSLSTSPTSTLVSMDNPKDVTYDLGVDLLLQSFVEESSAVVGSSSNNHVAMISKSKSEAAAASSASVSKQTQIACQNCHARKVKCDGREPCGRCIKDGVSCIRNRSSRFSHRSKRKRPDLDNGAKTATTAMVVPTIKVSNDNSLVDGIILTQLLQIFNDYLWGSFYAFSMDIQSDINSTNIAKRVRSDAVLALCARAVGNRHLFHQFSERARLTSPQIMEETTVESAGAVFMLAMLCYGQDLKKTRHLMRAACSMFQEAEPEKCEQNRLILSQFNGHMNGNNMTRLFASSAWNLLVGGAQKALVDILSAGSQQFPAVVWNVRDAFQRQGVSSNLGPFDFASFMGIGEKDAVRASTVDRTLLQELIARTEATLNYYKSDNSMLGDDEKMKASMTIFAATQIMVANFYLGNIESCKGAAIEALDAAIAYPPQCLQPDWISNLTHILEISIELRDWDIFQKSKKVFQGMSLIPAAAAIVTTMDDDLEQRIIF